MSEEKQKITLEERFANIERILEQMEEPGVSLDRSFALYQSGISEVKKANDMLDTVEKAMLVISGEGELEEF